MEATRRQANEVSAAEGHGHGASARLQEELDDTESARQGCGISGSVADRYAHQNASTAPVTMGRGRGSARAVAEVDSRGARGTCQSVGCGGVDAVERAGENLLGSGQQPESGRRVVDDERKLERRRVPQPVGGVDQDAVWPIA